jgi:hypothetical protein
MSGYVIKIREVVQSQPRARTIGFTMDAGTNITLGYKGHIQVPFSGTIFKWSLIADEPGSITVDVLKCPYADYPPFSGTSIVGSEIPTLSSAAKAQDENLTTWDTEITQGDLIGFHVLSQSGLKRATLILGVYE